LLLLLLEARGSARLRVPLGQLDAQAGDLARQVSGAGLVPFQLLLQRLDLVN
jgi:hypothetical protein